MDVQRYISSGIIESYVVGIVNEREAREVEKAMADHPEIKTAVDACRQDMERYVKLHAVAPPKAIRKRILEVLDEEETPAGEALLPEELRAPEKPEPFASSNGVKEKVAVSPAKMWQYAFLLALVLLGISVIMNLKSGGRYKDFETKYEDEKAAHTQLKDEYQAANKALDDALLELNLLKNPAFKWTRLAGMGKHAGQLATIGWNPQTKEVYLLAQSLPEPEAGQQYQLWAIVNGKPIDAGTFQMGELHTHLQKMKEVVAAQVFAITLEKKDGNDAPALDQIFVAAKVNLN